MVNRDRNTSRVKVKQATQVYQKQEFELDSANLSQIEIEIAQKPLTLLFLIIGQNKLKRVDLTSITEFALKEIE